MLCTAWREGEHQGRCKMRVSGRCEPWRLCRWDDIIQGGDNTWKFHITALVTVAISSSESSFGRSSLLFAHTTIRTAWQLDKSSFASIISSRIATTVADKISSFALLNDDNCKLIKWAKKPLCGWHRRQQYHIHVDNRHNNHSPYPLWYPIKFMTG